jgi:hypothetical protein
MLDDEVAVHAVGGTQRQQGKSARYCYYMCRNRLLFAAVHVARRDRWRWLRLAPRYARLVAFADGRRAALRRPSTVAAAIAGTIVGTTRLWR